MPTESRCKEMKRSHFFFFLTIEQSCIEIVIEVYILTRTIFLSEHKRRNITEVLSLKITVDLCIN